MFSFLKGLTKSSEVETHINRIAKLMLHFEKYGVVDRLELVKALNADFRLNIPTDLADPDSRVWPGPADSNLRVSFCCNDPYNPNLVNLFMFIGIDQLENILISGSTADGGETYTWVIGIAPGAHSVSKLSQQMQTAFWQIPGYKDVALGNHRFLIRKK